MSSKVLKHYPTAEAFAVGFNLTSTLQLYIEHKTIESALKARKIKLRELSAIYGQPQMMGFISLWLISLAKLMDFEISDEQAKLTAMDILSEMYMLNLAEFSLLFSRIKNGDYGVFYGKFNIQTIMKACKQFRQERGRFISNLSTKEQQDLKL